MPSTLNMQSTSPAATAGKISTALAASTLIACWLGMVFDGMDTNNFILSLHPALKEVLHTSSDALIGSCGAGIIASFMVGWAIGSVAFGFLADRIGRARALVATVALYATCTGACAFVHSWQELAILRFLVGCGVGGEASIGGVIVAELWSGRSRLHATGLLQTGFPCGVLLLAAVNLLIGHCGWRWLYIVGMTPALLAIYMRVKLDDSPNFKKVRAYRQTLLAKQKDTLTGEEKDFLAPAFVELFAGANLKKIIVITILASCTCIGTYAVLSWVPPWINQITGTIAVRERSWAAISQSLGNILGALTAGLIIAGIGRKWAFRMAHLGALFVCSMMFLTTKEVGAGLLVWTFLSGFFVLGPFTHLFIYVPELFDTRIRATAFAFSIQSGRLFAAIGCLAGGYLVKELFNGSYALAGASMALVYIIGLAATFFMPRSDGTVSNRL